MNGIAKWDGASWSSVGSSSIVSVKAMLFDTNENLLVVEGSPPYQILQWD